jgi:hypothetical protein
MKLEVSDVIWTPFTDDDNPNAGNVRVEHHLSGWQRTEGDRWMPAKSLGPIGGMNMDQYPGLLAMFILFNTLVVRDGIDPNRAHRAFLAIEEYRLAVSPDAPGADA